MLKPQKAYRIRRATLVLGECGLLIMIPINGKQIRDNKVIILILLGKRNKGIKTMPRIDIDIHIEGICRKILKISVDCQLDE